MSRRHKETETIKNYAPQIVLIDEDDIHVTSFLKIKIANILKNIFSPPYRWKKETDKKLAEIIGNAFNSRDIEIDDKWVKIPRSLFEVHLDETTPYEAILEEKSKRGRPIIKRLLSKIADSEVIGYFKKTLKTVQTKSVELYKDIAQFSVCFLKGIHNVFCPDDDPYGKISHYHRMLDEAINGIPTRKTISNCYKWFVEWKVVCTDTVREKAEKAKHRLWMKLMEWIQSYLLKIAPQYAIV